MNGRVINPIRATCRALIGGVSGAVNTAVIGALIGLFLWLTGLGFSYSWLDWPIGGAIFGVVVGGIGGTIGGAFQGAWGRVAVILGAVLPFSFLSTQNETTSKNFARFCMQPARRRRY
jgi:hypothetical protein